MAANPPIDARLKQMAEHVAALAKASPDVTDPVQQDTLATRVSEIERMIASLGQEVAVFTGSPAPPMSRQPRPPRKGQTKPSVF